MTIHTRERGKNYVWTDEIIDSMKRMFLAGKSAKVIAESLPPAPFRPSRNAVIGKLHRLGVVRCDNRGNVSRKVAEKREVVKRIAVKPRKIAEAPALAPVTIAEDVSDGGVEYLDLAQHHCRSLKNVRGSDGLLKSCGRPVVAVDGVDTSWCADHYRLYMTPPQQRTRRNG